MASTIDYKTLVETVLVAVVAWLLKLLLATIGVEIDPVLFNTIVAGIVTWLLALMFRNTGQNIRAAYLYRKSLKQPVK